MNGCSGTDGDRIANKFPFQRGKPSPSMSKDFKKALENQGYLCVKKSQQAKVVFPPLTPSIRHQILSIQRDDYENPYPNIDPEFKTFKALMEFIASLPLESMTQEEIVLYLNELEETFSANEGPFLHICNQIIFACPISADEPFLAAFKIAHQKQTEDFLFRKIQDKIDLGYHEEAKEALGDLLNSLEGQDLNKSIEGFQLMSEIYLQDKKFAEAPGILWYVKQLLSQGEWDKAFKCAQYLSAILEVAPNLYFQYELLDVLAFNENPLTEGECIPVDILRNFIILKVYQGQEKYQILPDVAKYLLKKMTDLKLEGHKVEEIKDFSLVHCKD
ncbi:MAG: hypothetical protein H0T62_11120 [Parachlamydiaceae bacterium]|nr:hypothetical protein [Parachlamydiaceae bacterium]